MPWDPIHVVILSVGEQKKSDKGQFLLLRIIMT